MKKKILFVYACLSVFNISFAIGRDSVLISTPPQNPGGQVTVTYSSGDIPADVVDVLQGNNTPNNCPASLAVNIPSGNQITSVNVAYTMTSYNTTVLYSQYSLLKCVTNNTAEASLTSGTGANAGTATYNRTGLSIANGLTGNVVFELRAWWLLGNETPNGCGTDHAKVNNGSWTITVNYTCTPPPPPPALPSYTFCMDSLPLFSEIGIGHVPGATLKWYHYLSNTEISENAVADSGTYQVSQILGECESDRVNFNIIVPTIFVPQLPTTTFCYGATVADLATPDPGGSFTWRLNGAIVSPASLLVTGNYSGIQTIAGCQSVQLNVAITVNSTPQPIVPVTQQFCAGTTVADLIDTPNTQWYLNDLLLTDTELLVSGTYSARQTLNNCQSTSKAVSVMVSTVPPMDAPVEQLLCGSNFTIADLEIHPVPGATVVWSDGGNNIYPVTTVLPQSTMYSVTQTLNGCESEPVIIAVVVYPIPNIPIVTGSVQYLGEGSIIYDLDPYIYIDETAGGNSFYILGEDGELQPVSGNDLLTDGQTYYITSNTIVGCESEPVTITVNLILKTTDFTINNLKVFPVPVKNTVTFTSAVSLSTISIYNLLGQEVLHQEANNTSVMVNMESLSAGSYIAKIFSENGNSSALKIIKE